MDILAYIGPLQITIFVLIGITVLVTRIVLSILVWTMAHAKGYDRMAPIFVLIALAISATVMLVVMFLLPVKEPDTKFTYTDASGNTTSYGGQRGETDAGSGMSFCPNCGSRVYPGTVTCPTCGHELSSD